jgi:hypothetical protein
MRSKRKILSASALRGLHDAMDRYRFEYMSDREAFTKQQAADMANATRWLHTTTIERGGIRSIQPAQSKIRIVKGAR